VAVASVGSGSAQLTVPLAVGVAFFVVAAVVACGGDSPLWTAATDHSAYQEYGSPSVARGIVCVGSVDGRLYAFNAKTGKRLWSAATGDTITSSPAIADGVVYVGSWDHKLYAFDARSGQRPWSAATGSAIASSPAVAHGFVYVDSEDDNLYAYSLTR
jgi:outer membrane protein assembly factor BamB